jgi:hypothetical protein
MQPLKKSNQRWMIWLVVGVWVLALGQVVWSWGNNVNVSQNAGNSYRPAVAVDSANTIHVVWSDTSINYPGNSEILYRQSSDGGVTWSPVQNLSGSANESIRPMIAAAGPNTVAVSWIDGGQIHARVWNGMAWSPSEQLSTGSALTQRLSIAINQSGVALAAWSEGSLVDLYGYGGPAATGYLYSRWNGSAWAAPVPMTGRLVAMRGNLAYLVTSQRTLLRSIDAGATWASPIALPQGYLVPDDMKIDSQNRLRMAWLGPTQNAVYAASYTGQAFSAPVLVSTGGDPNPYKDVSLAINKNDQLALVWSKNSIVSYYGYSGAMQRTMQVLASQSTDGQSWTTPTSIASTSGCFGAVAGSQLDTRFYGAWQSPDCLTGESPDIYVVSQNGIFHQGPTFSIAGRVQAIGGAPLAGVTVSAGSTASILSDVNGNYMLTGLITGTYTLTAAKSGYRFSVLPPIAVPPARIGQNFTEVRQVYLPLTGR